ncbi:MAG: C40 family peptidase [Alloprevotella sp.]
MTIRNLLTGVAFAVIAFVMAAHSIKVQARYEDDVTEYATLVAGDPLPVQAKMERQQAPLTLIDLTRFSLNAQEIAKREAEAEEEAARAAESRLDNLLATAYKCLGVRYRSGRSGPDGFDCSGFTRYVFRQHDIQLTHSSRAQYNEGTRVEDIAQLQKGDLVFFGGSRSSKNIGHVGIVTEVDPSTKSFKFIHASTSSGIKVDSSRDPYYTRRYVGACRVLQ